MIDLLAYAIAAAMRRAGYEHAAAGFPERSRLYSHRELMERAQIWGVQ